MENLHRLNSESYTIQELAEKAKITLSSVAGQLPEAEEELGKLTSLEAKAWFNLDFLGQVADSNTIRDYFRITRKEIEIVDFGLRRRLSYFSLLLGGAIVTPRNTLRSVNVALIIGPDGLEVKGGMFLNPINNKDNFTLLQRRDSKAVRIIGGLNLGRCLSKIEAAIK